MIIQELIITNLLKFIILREDPRMYLDSEWQFVNDRTSEKFQKMESHVIFNRVRVNEHLRHFERLKISSVNLISLINDELENRK